MRTIYKYPLGVDVTIALPRGWIFRHLAAQGNVITLWAEVDTAAELETCHFTAHGTGWDLAAVANATYLGTALMPDGYVWHVYERSS